MKYIVLFFCLVIIFSCQTESQAKTIERLKKNNDSLTNILREIEGKYIFDSISFREIPNQKNTSRLNSVYSFELLVVGYSPNKNYFVKYDTIINGEKINPNILKQSNAGLNITRN